MEGAARPTGRMRRHAAWLAVVLGVACGLAGCSRVTYNAMISPAYRPYVYGYGAGRRDLATVIRGNPFDLAQEQFEARLLDKLNSRPTMLQPTHFTATPGPSARPEFKAVFLINAEIRLANRICRNPDAAPPADLGTTIRITAVFCRYRGFLTTVTGEVQGVEQIDDPRFDALLTELVILLFPPTDPTKDDDPRFLRLGALSL